MPNNQNVTRQSVFTNNKQDSRPKAPPPHTQQNNAVQPIDTGASAVSIGMVLVDASSTLVSNEIMLGHS